MSASADVKGFSAFEFDLPEALLASLIVVFDGMEAASLTRANLEGVPDAQGVYRLLLGQDIVYMERLTQRRDLPTVFRVTLTAFNIA